MATKGGPLRKGDPPRVGPQQRRSVDGWRRLAAAGKRMTRSWRNSVMPCGEETCVCIGIFGARPLRCSAFPHIAA